MNPSPTRGREFHRHSLPERLRQHPVEPQFPFGHGLSYTRFTYANLTMDAQTLTVAFDIENAGERTGKETVQLYISDLTSSVERPVKELKAFQKIELAPGQRRTLRFQLDRKAFSFFDPATRAWIVEPGEFGILIGSSSRDIRLEGRLALE